MVVLEACNLRSLEGYSCRYMHAYVFHLFYIYMYVIHVLYYLLLGSV
jgi:hypothetical protein